jgi:hypothetical protein
VGTASAVPWSVRSLDDPEGRKDRGRKEKGSTPQRASNQLQGWRAATERTPRRGGEREGYPKARVSQPGLASGTRKGEEKRRWERKRKERGGEKAETP